MLKGQAEPGPKLHHGQQQLIWAWWSGGCHRSLCQLRQQSWRRGWGVRRSPLRSGRGGQGHFWRGKVSGELPRFIVSLDFLNFLNSKVVPSQGEADMDPHSWEQCKYPPWHSRLWFRYPRNITIIRNLILGPVAMMSSSLLWLPKYSSAPEWLQISPSAATMWSCAIFEKWVQSGNGYCGYGGQADVITHCANSDNDLRGNQGFEHSPWQSKRGRGQRSCFWRGKVGGGLPAFFCF